MSSGERPIGATKGKQSDTKALCQPPPPPPERRTVLGKDEVHRWENLVGPSLVHTLLGPSPPPPSARPPSSIAADFC